VARFTHPGDGGPDPALRRSEPYGVWDRDVRQRSADGVPAGIFRAAMPTYVYKFVETGETIEIQQSFHDDTLTEAVHPQSGETLPVKKVFQPVGVTFKGDGFYKTDSRAASKKQTDGASKSSESKSGDTKSADSKSSDTKSESKSTESKSTESKSGSGSTPPSPSTASKSTSSKSD
jgi:predicted nucleic acid-binding Zn ribbon protein